MSFLPEQETRSRLSMNLAPMLDFLFLMLVFFASLAVSRVTTRDTQVSLVQIQPETHPATSTPPKTIVNISIDKDSQYKWVTELQDYPLAQPQAIAAELLSQHSQGLIPSSKADTQVLLRIDRDAKWEPILAALFAIREAGFDVKPLYEPLEETASTPAGAL